MTDVYINGSAPSCRVSRSQGEVEDYMGRVFGELSRYRSVSLKKTCINKGMHFT